MTELREYVRALFADSDEPTVLAFSPEATPEVADEAATAFVRQLFTNND